MFWNKEKETQSLELKKQYLQQWQLEPDGAYFFSYASLLQPVIYRHQKAMLKISLEEEEQFGGLLMQWWDGYGAAKVFQYTREALLLERITGHLSLKQIAANGRDDEATGVICATAKKLHQTRSKPLPELIDLNDWFYELLHAHEKYSNRFMTSAAIARELLETTTTKTVLHGDLHHENILYSDKRGWLAIDPKRLYGDEGFEYANLFCNPAKEIALAPGRLQLQLKVVCTATGIPAKRMLQWIAAWSALSGIWMLSVAEDPDVPFTINRMALTALNR
ncbi:hypothetical protein A8C56_07285 [Niabella ginsenosidivorans]|uniref:3'-kinase n=1 Tax=Niabella ginsenosidivorans TaxID=1176587 RepID=A0A1A9HZJ6_9BACT|nr:aminoglycoside phosphotransferase family protein [Niabella ginsenosidivorans]ANH80806.1 hypothetical protein A8C56_07285 [Niabella ginsenosidivorans]